MHVGWASRAEDKHMSIPRMSGGWFGSALAANQSVHLRIFWCIMVLKFCDFAADVIADTFLVVAPLHLWKDLRFPRHRKILVMSAFSATILITVITIPQSIILFKIPRETPLLLAHVKVSIFSSPHIAAASDGH